MKIFLGIALLLGLGATVAVILNKVFHLGSDLVEGAKDWVADKVERGEKYIKELPERIPIAIGAGAKSVAEQSTQTSRERRGDLGGGYFGSLSRKASQEARDQQAKNEAATKKDDLRSKLRTQIALIDQIGAAGAIDPTTGVMSTKAELQKKLDALGENDTPEGPPNIMLWADPVRGGEGPPDITKFET